MNAATKSCCPARQKCNDDAEAGIAMSGTQTHLKVKDVMNQDVVTASPGESILSAAKKMSINSVSCVVVVDDHAVVGLFTEKDLLKGITQEQNGFCQLPVAERMSSPVIVASPNLPVLEAGRIIKSKHIKHLPVVADQRLIGIVTQTDITRGLIYLTPLQRVSEIMSPDIAMVDVEATVEEAARVMWSRRISCVVVTHHMEPAGILTQKDILRRIIAPQKNPARTRVSDVMSVPVLPIPPSYSVFTASRIMDRMHIHRLVVQGDKQIRGIVSQTDILRAVERRLQEEEKQRQFQAGSEIPMFTLDAQGMVTYANTAFLRLLGREASDEVVGTLFLNEGFRSRPQDEKRLRQMLRKGQSGLLRLVVRTGPDAVKRILLLLAVTKNDAGEIIGWQGVAWRQD